MNAIVQRKSNETNCLDFNNLDTALKSATIISSSNFCPVAYKGKAGDVLCAIQYGNEIGLKPMQSLQGIAVINGKPSLYGDALRALCMSHPDFEDVITDLDETTMVAMCTVKRRSRTPVIKTFSQKDAEVAGLWGKSGPWKLYPKVMLAQRAENFALRKMFADILCGIISQEEAQDYVPMEKTVNPIYSKPRDVISSVKEKLMTQPAEDAEIIEPSEPAESLPEDVYNTLLDMIIASEVSDDVVEKWKEKAKVKNLKDLSMEQAEKVIQFLSEKLNDKEEDVDNERT